MQRFEGEVVLIDLDDAQLRERVSKENSSIIGVYKWNIESKYGIYKQKSNKQQIKDTGEIDERNFLDNQQLSPRTIIERTQRFYTLEVDKVLHNRNTPFEEVRQWGRVKENSSGEDHLILMRKKPMTLHAAVLNLRWGKAVQHQIGFVHRTDGIWASIFLMGVGGVIDLEAILIQKFMLDMSIHDDIKAQKE